MKFELGAIYKTKEQRDSEYIICPIRNYNRDKYLNKRLLIRTILWCIFAFGLGYNLYWFNESIYQMRNFIFTFLLVYVVSFYLLQIPHEFLHLVFYPKTFTDKDIEVKFLNNKRLVTCISHSPISSIRLCCILIIPFALFTLFPLIYLSNSDFNIYLYGIITSNAILSSDDLINIILQFFIPPENGLKFLYELDNIKDTSLDNKENLDDKDDIIDINKEN